MASTGLFDIVIIVVVIGAFLLILPQLTSGGNATIGAVQTDTSGGGDAQASDTGGQVTAGDGGGAQVSTGGGQARAGTGGTTATAGGGGARACAGGICVSAYGEKRLDFSNVL